jgi:hypothetical protein
VKGIALSLTYVPGWDSASQAHSRVSSVNYDIEGSMNNSCNIPNVKVLA